MRILLISICLCFAFSGTVSGQALYVRDFSTESGAMANLTSEAKTRKIFIDTLNTKMPGADFSVVFGVKAVDDEQEYEFLNLQAISGIKDTSTWAMGKTSTGAWYWQASKGAVYEYRATAQRQSLLNEKVMLAFTYNSAKKEVWLYYNGLNVAIYYVPEMSVPDYESLIMRFGGIKKGELNHEWDTFNGYLGHFQLYDTVISPDKIKELSGNRFDVNGHSADQLKVMTFNIWHGGRERGKYVGPKRVAETIRDAGADVVAMQETYGSGALIADLLGYYFYLRSDNLSIMSRYPIIETLDAHAPFYSGAAILETGGRKVAIATTWLNYPLDYWDNLEKGVRMNEKEWLVKQDKNAKTLQAVLEKLKPAIHRTDEIPLILCGDFNSGSHRDWIVATRHTHQGYVMPFPATKLMESYGFTDSYRHIYPDPVTHPGITWSPVILSAFPDRIDYIFYKGSTLYPVQSEVIGKHPVSYPSDHGAVITFFEFKK